MADNKWMQKVAKKIKKEGTDGSFREYCGGKVTMECIERGLKSKDPKVRKRAALAKAFMKSKKAEGGEINNELLDLIDTFSPRTAQAVLTDLDRYNQRMNQMAMLKAALGIEVKEEGRNNNTIVNKYAFGGQMRKYQEGGDTMSNEQQPEQTPMEQPQQVNENQPQNEFGYDISYTQFVQFVSQYPEYFKRLISELQAQQQQMNSPTPEQPMQ